VEEEARETLTQENRRRIKEPPFEELDATAYNNTANNKN
jgi:hypothetical protein